jgi:hypothetical protein
VFRVTSDDKDGGRGVGKTTLARAAARLVGGSVDLRQGEDVNDFLKRLLSPDGTGRRVALIDNLKTEKFSWADVEALITADAISGRRLYVGEGRRPNDLVWFVTVNGGGMSRDMAQRSVVIKLKRPAYSPTWEADLFGLIESRRWEIIGDLLAELKKPAPALASFCRWSQWEAAVLARVDNPVACQEAIKQRSDDADADDDDAEAVRETFMAFIRTQTKADPDELVLFFQSSLAAKLVSRALEQPVARNKVKTRVQSIGARNLVPADRKGKKGTRGLWWRGDKAPRGAEPIEARDEPAEQGGAAADTTPRLPIG